jgi:hypothetical protein
MQLAGATCGRCNRTVLFAVEATWCARCCSVLHRECLSQTKGICPKCHDEYESPEAQFVFSSMCPECFHPNTLVAERCPKCSARTRWDTQPAFEEFLDHMKDTSRVYMLRGLAELVAAIFSLIGFVGLLFFFKVLWLLILSLLAFMTLTADAVHSVSRSRKIAKFR